MSDREKRLEEIQRTISDHVLRLQRLSVQFTNMMADDAWENDDELPSLDALSAFLLWLMRRDVHPGIGSNGRGSITAFWREGDIKHTIDFLPSGKMANNRYLVQKEYSHE
jgi:hypothetical protein